MDHVVAGALGTQLGVGVGVTASLIIAAMVVSAKPNMSLLILAS